MKDDYCTASPDKIFGFKLAGCCKIHDNMVGEKGTYCPISPSMAFFNCLWYKTVTVSKWYKKPLGLFVTILYTTVGSVFAWIKYPYFVYVKYQYRNGN